jgi:probable rRNA maturation factor
MEIEIADRQDAVDLDPEEVRRVLLLALDMAGRDATLSVVLTGDAEIRELNSRFAGRDSATDVLAFAYDGEADCVEGEIVVNAELAARQAASRPHSPEGELVLYLVHGLLHLLGHDDHDADETRRMREQEQEVLAAAGYRVVF